MFDTMYLALGPAGRRAGVLVTPLVASVAPSQYFRQPTNERVLYGHPAVGRDAGV
jgi:hypothetical protein